jgi:hypothetical protein
MIRAHRGALMSAGVLTRVGREIIVLGARYTKWLETQSANVTRFEIAANRARSVERPIA